MSAHVQPIRPDEAMVIDIKLRREILETAEEMLTKAVIRARGADVSWERIAEALDVRRQSAMERYGKLVNDAG